MCIKQGKHLERDLCSLRGYPERKVVTWLAGFTSWLDNNSDLSSFFSLALRKRGLHVKGRKKGKLAGKSFLGQNHYPAPCHLLVANLLFKIISLAVIRTVKSGHSLRLSSFSPESGMSFFS